MNGAWVALMVILVSIGCLVVSATAEMEMNTTDALPNLTGVWKGTSSGYMVGLGFSEDSMVYTITEQNGPAFIGYKEYSFEGEEPGREDFAGIITDDGTIYIVDYPGGTVIGTLTGSDEMKLNSFNDGKDSYVFVSTMRRESN